MPSITTPIQATKRQVCGLPTNSLILCLGALCVLFVAGCGQGETYKCVGVTDGDTVRVLAGRRMLKVRLFGIDCPERGQDFGRKAKQFTSSLVFGKQVRLQSQGKDRYDRTIAWVWVDDVCVNKELVRNGLAWWYRKYAPHEWELSTLEAKARKARIGLWSMPKPIPPWEYRKSQRHKKPRPWFRFPWAA